MTDLARFFAYARAFEVAVLSDDWTVLERFFAPDAEHRVRGPAPFECDDRGRDAVIAGLRASVARIERRCDARIPEILLGPEVRPDGIWMRFGVALRRAGLPHPWFEGDHLVVYRDGQIARIDEWMDPATSAATAAWFAEHEDRLHPVGTRATSADPDAAAALESALARTLARLRASASGHRDDEALREVGEIRAS